jgi:CheY-like chemotaxis protein
MQWPSKCHILIVDDDEDMRNLMTLYLKDVEGVTFECAEDAIEGLEILRDSKSFDLLISDVMMPEMNGVEFIQHASGFYPYLKIIVCSSGGASRSNNRSADELMEMALHRGAHRALKKPFSKEVFLETLEGVLFGD